MATISAQSLEYLHVPFTANVDPLTVTAEVAVVATDTIPTGGDWKDATIIDSTARILVGAGGDVTPAAGSYRVWVRIGDAPEIPVEDVGDLLVTP